MSARFSPSSKIRRSPSLSDAMIDRSLAAKFRRVLAGRDDMPWVLSVFLQEPRHDFQAAVREPRVEFLPVAFGLLFLRDAGDEPPSIRAGDLQCSERVGRGNDVNPVLDVDVMEETDLLPHKSTMPPGMTSSKS